MTTLEKLEKPFEKTTPYERTQIFLDVYKQLTSEQKQKAMEKFIEIFGVTKESFLLFVSFDKLFNDMDYYETVRSAVGERLFKDFKLNN